jgi:hypothetical protein
LATVVDSRAKFDVKAAVVVPTGAEAALAAGKEEAKAARRRHGLVAQLHGAFKAFELKGKAGVMDASDLVLLVDALGVPPSAPSLQELRDLVADHSTKKRGSILASSKDTKVGEGTSLRDDGGGGGGCRVDVGKRAGSYVPRGGWGVRG